MPEEQLPLIHSAYAPNALSKLVMLKTTTWADLSAWLTKERVVASDAKTKSPLFFAGTFSGEPDEQGRVLRKGALVSRSMISLDIDHCDLSLVDIEERLEFGISGCYAAYTTFNHRSSVGGLRVRVFIPLSRDVTPDEYKALAPQVAREIGLFDYCDPCSWRPSEGMFVNATDDAGKEDRWRAVVSEGGYWPVPDAIEGVVEKDSVGSADSGDSDGLEDLLADVKRESFSEEQVDDLLDRYDPEHLHYDQWLEVGSALNWRYEGSDEGYDKWVEWSARSSKHNVSKMSGKWKSLDPKARNPTTLATIVMRVKDSSVSAVLRELDSGREGDGEDAGEDTREEDAGKGKEKISVSTAVDRLVDRARNITSEDEYRTVLRSINLLSPSRHQVVSTDVGRLATALVKSPFGIEAGFSKLQATDTVKQQLGYKTKADFIPGETVTVDEDGHACVRIGAPEWCRQWCFVVEENVFYNLHTMKRVDKSAFDTQYASEPVVRDDADYPSANRLVAAKNWVLMVDAVEFNPTKESFYSELSGSEMVMDSDGVERLRKSRTLVNSYAPPALSPASDERMASDESRAVIERLQWHTHFIIGNEDLERTLFDWLAHNIQFPGRKITWAVLMQGFYGIGKTYYYELLKRIFGEYVKVITDADISSGFSAWATGSLINCIEEIRNKTNKYEVVEALKPYITNASIPSTAKGKDPTSRLNFTNYLAFTNYEDALPMDEGDRRYFVLFSRIKNKIQLRKELLDRVLEMGLSFGDGEDAPNGAYFNQLYGDLDNYKDVIYRFFLDYKISDTFVAKGIAPMSEAKQIMIDNSVPQYVIDVHNVIAAQKDNPVVNEHIVDTKTLVRLCASEMDAPKGRWLAKALSDLGYVYLRGKRGVKIGTQMRTIYVKDIDHEEAMDVCKDYEFDMLF